MVEPTVSLNVIEGQGEQMTTVSPDGVVAVVLYSYPMSHTHAWEVVEPVVYVVEPRGHRVALVAVDDGGLPVVVVAVVVAVVVGEGGQYEPTGHKAYSPSDVR